MESEFQSKFLEQITTQMALFYLFLVEASKINRYLQEIKV